MLHVCSSRFGFSVMAIYAYILDDIVGVTDIAIVPSGKLNVAMEDHHF